MEEERREGAGGGLLILVNAFSAFYSTYPQALDAG